MSVVLKRGGGVILGAGQKVTQEKVAIETVVDGVLMKDSSDNWILTDVSFDSQRMKKLGFEDGDNVKVTVRIVK